MTKKTDYWSMRNLNAMAPRDVFGKVLVEMGTENENIVGVCPDVMVSTRFNEFAKSVLREGRSAVLDCPAHAVVIPGNPAEVQQGIKVYAYLGNRAVGKNNPTVGGAGLDADFTQTCRTWSQIG